MEKPETEMERAERLIREWLRLTDEVMDLPTWAKANYRETVGGRTLGFNALVAVMANRLAAACRSVELHNTRKDRV